ncbi:N-6 DNA methylase [Dactylosporangium sp. NPDC051541]|uniref:N-6 DNA methylase n=1 Tax=Dactylosporangium sp. NPDC051541 TaxID=3363977 RepID=UPI0037B0ED2E
MTSADIARISGVKPTAVSNWRRRHNDFPKPVAGTDRSPRFDLAQVESWLKSQGRNKSISSNERLWQAFDSVRGAVPPEEALAAVGMILLHQQKHGRSEQSELTRLMAQAGRTFVDVVGVDLAGHVPETDTAGLVTLLDTAVHAVRDSANDVNAASEVFELLCTRFLDTVGRAGFTATPPELADLLVQLAGGATGALLDPTCGSGTILLAAAGHGYRRVLGQDINPAIARIAALRLALRDSTARPASFTVRDADSLRHPATSDDQITAVVSTPPFADRNWGYEDLAYSLTWEYGVPPKLEPELAWVQHALNRVTPSGAVVLLMPPGAASRPSGRRIRRELLTRGALRAIISLPPGLAAHYSLALQIWVLYRPEQDTTAARVLLVDTDGEISGGKPAAIWAQVHAVVVGSWQRFRTDPDNFAERPGIARAVPLADLLDEEVDLTPRRALPLPPPPAVTDDELIATRDQLVGLLSALGDTLPGAIRSPQVNTEPVRTMTLNELAKTGAVFIRRTPTPSPDRTSDAPTKEGRIVTGDDLLAGKPPTKVGDVNADEVRNPPIRAGDVLAPLVARRVTARVATAEDVGAYPSSTVYVVRTDPTVLDPWYLAGYLSSSDGERQAERMGSSLGGHLRVDLRRVRIPLVPIETQRAYGQLFQELAEFTRHLRATHDLGMELASNSIDAIASSLTVAGEPPPEP